MRSTSARRRLIVPGVALAMSGCFLISGLEDEATSGGSTSDGASTSSLATTSDTSASSGQGGAPASSGAGSTSSGEGGSGGMAPIAYARTFEGVRFESFAHDGDTIYVGGTKDPAVTTIDGLPLGAGRSLIVVAFDAATGDAKWAKALRSYPSVAPASRSISLALGANKLIVATTTTTGLWVEGIGLDGAAMPDEIARCLNPSAQQGFYRNVKLATRGTDFAVAFDTSTGNDTVTFACNGAGPSNQLTLTGANEDVLLFVADENGATDMLDLTAGNAARELATGITFMDDRIAVAFTRGGSMPDAMVAVAQREANLAVPVGMPLGIAKILGGYGNVVLAGQSGSALVSGAARSFNGITAGGPGAGHLRTRVLDDPDLAVGPRRLDWDGIDDFTTAGAFFGTSVRIAGARTIVAGWVEEAQRMTGTSPTEGALVGGDGLRSLFFGEYDTATYDILTRAVSLPLGPRAQTASPQPIVEASLLDDALVAAGVMPNASTLCGRSCDTAGPDELGCAFLLRQPMVPLVDNGGEPRVAAGCHVAP